MSWAHLANLKQVNFVLSHNVQRLLPSRCTWTWIWHIYNSILLWKLSMSILKCYVLLHSVMWSYITLACNVLLSDLTMLPSVDRSAKILICYILHACTFSSYTWWQGVKLGSRVMVVLFNIQRYCMVEILGGTCTISHRIVACTHLLVTALFAFIKFADSACLHKILSKVMLIYCSVFD